MERPTELPSRKWTLPFAVIFFIYVAALWKPLWASSDARLSTLPAWKMGRSFPLPSVIQEPTANFTITAGLSLPLATSLIRYVQSEMLASLVTANEESLLPNLKSCRRRNSPCLDEISNQTLKNLYPGLLRLFSSGDLKPC